MFKYAVGHAYPREVLPDTDGRDHRAGDRSRRDCSYCRLDVPGGYRLASGNRFNAPALPKTAPTGNYFTRVN